MGGYWGSFALSAMGLVLSPVTWMHACSFNSLLTTWGVCWGAYTKKWGFWVSGSERQASLLIFKCRRVGNKNEHSRRPGTEDTPGAGSWECKNQVREGIWAGILTPGSCGPDCREAFGLCVPADSQPYLHCAVCRRLFRHISSLSY